MEKAYVVAAAVVVAAVIWRGAYTNAPRQEGPIARITRGEAPRGSLLENLRSRSVENANSETARGSYPPRALGLAAQRKPPSDSWLLDADSDRERFRRLEVAMGGIDVNMREIGQRFTVLHDAIERGNFELAEYERAKILEAARIAAMKRPGFASEDGIKYMGAKEWTALDQAMKARNIAQSRSAFQQVRNSCIACHNAQGLNYLNNNELFENSAKFSSQPQQKADASAAAGR